MSVLHACPCITCKLHTQQSVDWSPEEFRKCFAPTIVYARPRILDSIPISSLGKHPNPGWKWTHHNNYREVTYWHHKLAVASYAKLHTGGSKSLMVVVPPFCWLGALPTVHLRLVLVMFKDHGVAPPTRMLETKVPHWHLAIVQTYQASQVGFSIHADSWSG